MSNFLNCSRTEKNGNHPEVDQGNKLNILRKSTSAIGQNPAMRATILESYRYNLEVFKDGETYLSKKVSTGKF